MENTQPMPTPKKKGGNAIGVILVLLIIIAAAVVMYLFGIFGPGVRPGSGELTPRETAAVTDGVAGLIELNGCESPLVARIDDAATLVGQQPFYQNATDGDYLMICADIGKAILYDLREDKLLNVGPIQINPEG